MIDRSLLFLIGMPGVGKTKLGKKLAGRSRDFFDTDEQIVRRDGRQIPEIFARDGEPAFRQLETSVLEEICRTKSAAVVATGGGVVENPRNIELLQAAGTVVWIDRPIAELRRHFDRLSTTRPLLQKSDDYKKIFQRRLPLYRRAAHYKLSPRKTLSTARDISRGVFVDSSSPLHLVIGSPIAHSQSPELYAQLGLDSPYGRALISAEQLPRFVDRVRRSGASGFFNVTIPHKQKIMPLLNAVDETAAACGAVNLVVVTSGKLTGYNTDMGGLTNDLSEHGVKWAGRNVAVIGSGGAAAAAVAAAKAGAAERITMFVGDPSRAAASRLAKPAVGPGDNRPRLAVLPISELSAANLQSIDLLINASPRGMAGADRRWRFANFDFLDGMAQQPHPAKTFVYDLVYVPEQTTLLKAAAAAGLPCAGGRGMLVHQAKLALQIYNRETI